MQEVLFMLKPVVIALKIFVPFHLLQAASATMLLLLQMLPRCDHPPPLANRIQELGIYKGN